MSVLFDRFTLKDIELRNRIAVPPMCQYSATELQLIKGLHSQQIATTLGFCPSEVVVHRDDIALLA